MLIPLACSLFGISMMLSSTNDSVLVLLSYFYKNSTETALNSSADVLYLLRMYGRKFKNAA